MKILHVLYSGLGGHGNVFFSFVKGAGKDAYEYEAIFNGIEPVKKEYIENCRHYNIPWHFVSKKPGADFNYYLDFVKKIKSSDATIAFLHSSAYILPAKLGSIFSKHKKKLVVRETQANHLKSKMEWFWLAIALLLADKIVFLSEAYRQEIAEKLSWFYNSKKIHVIPNGLDLDMYQPTLKTEVTEVTIGMQSRLVWLKDHLTLLEAFALLKADPAISMPVILKIAGDGDFRKTLEEKAASLQLGDAVVFTGMLDEKALLDFLLALDIYVHASLGETMSTAIMQAMACGLPVIASDVKGIQNMVEHGANGILVPVKNANALYTAMKELIMNTITRLSLARAGSAYAEKYFSNERMVNDYRELFNRH